MIKSTAVQLPNGADVLAYVFQFNGTHWVCLRSRDAGANRAWLECWSSKEGVAPDLAAALEAIDGVVRDHLKRGPLGAYVDGAHFIPGWNTWGGSVPAPIAEFRPNELAANADGPVELEAFMRTLGSTKGA